MSDFEVINSPYISTTTDHIQRSLPVDIIGTESDDTLQGTTRRDAIYAWGGDDVVLSDRGNDTIYGGYGDDYLYGDKGNDILYGDEGSDLLNGGEGNNILYGGEGNDRLWSDGSYDTLTGGPGGDRFYVSDYWSDQVCTITDFNRNEGDIMIFFPDSPRVHASTNSMQSVFSRQPFYDGQNTPAFLEAVPTVGYSLSGGIYNDPDGSGSSYTFRKNAQLAVPLDFSTLQSIGAIQI